MLSSKGCLGCYCYAALNSVSHRNVLLPALTLSLTTTTTSTTTSTSSTRECSKRTTTTTSNTSKPSVKTANARVFYAPVDKDTYDCWSLNKDKPKLQGYEKQTGSYRYKTTSPSERLQLTQRKMLSIKRPGTVLVEVHAASVNPIDIRMSDGYGNVLLDAYRNVESFWKWDDSVSRRPDVLGRDFSGVIVNSSLNKENFRVGDEVYGALPAIVQGTHAQYALVDTNWIAHKPKNLSHIEAAAIPYAMLTFLSAVNPTGCSNLRGLRVYLNGAAGGIGTLAVQYMKHMGCEVTVSVSGDGRDVVERLHPDHILDYKTDEFAQQLNELAGYDLVFDCVGDRSMVQYLKPGGRYVTVVAPLLPEVDKHGLLGGLASAAGKFSKDFFSTLTEHGAFYNWGYFMPSGSILREVTKLVEQGKILPVLDKVFPFTEVPAAYDKVANSSGRGKTVIHVKSA